MTLEFKQMITRREKEDFLTFVWQFYKDDPVWVPPLMPDVRERVDVKRGSWFKSGIAEFFLVYQEEQPVGRFSIGIDEKANQSGQKKEAVFGFFEVVEEYRIAEEMFAFMEEWARDHDMTTLYGPFNLDYEDAYGVLMEGFDTPQVMLCGHTPAYYASFFDNYGFEKGRPDTIAMRIDLTVPRPEFEKLHKMADHIRQKDVYSIRHADFSKWDEEIDVLHNLLNRALAHLEGHIPWQRPAVESLVSQFRRIADEELILFAVDNKTGETVGFFPGTPDMNEHFNRFNGLRYWWNYPGFLLNYKKPTRCLTVKSVLLLPEYWGGGVAILMFDELLKRVQKIGGYEWVDLSLTAINNPQTPKLGRKMGAEIYRRYRIYRKVVDG